MALHWQKLRAVDWGSGSNPLLLPCGHSFSAAPGPLVLAMGPRTSDCTPPPQA
jgi:hypothetical protein